MPRTRCGLDVLLEQKLDIIRGRRIGMVTNHSAVNRNLVHAVDLLRAMDIQIGALFAPEHGVRGDVQAGQPVQNATDERTGIPVYSLYGQTKKPTPEMLKGLDAVIFDAQDVGARFYTFIYTMYYAMQVCAQNNIPFIVLDRPNPISGQAVEGNILDRQFASFVGLFPMPIRHGMTMGELAMMFNGELSFLCDLKIIGCTGWKRSMYYDETELAWVQPSPNIPSPDTALVYPGTCFLEGTNISEGRGTTKPFEILGAPWIDGYALADALNSLSLPGVRFRPAYFTPATSKFAQQMCGGVQIHVTERKVFEPVKMGLHIVKILCGMYPDSIKFLPAGNSGKLFFDFLAGTDRIRTALQSQTSVDELVNSWFYDLRSFLDVRKKYLIYL